jgi:diguanylate cyclase (GGDEF)-like protein
MTPTQVSHSVAHEGPLIALQRRRLNLVLLALGGALLAAWIVQVMNGWGFSATVLTIDLVAIAQSYRWSQLGHMQRAVKFTLLWLTVSLSVLMFNGEGLYDESVVAFPGMLLCASMVGSRRLFWGMLGATLLVYVVDAALHFSGVHPMVVKPFAMDRLINVSSITCVTAYFIWLISGDLHRAMHKLEEEKERIRESHERIEVLAHRDTLTNLPNRTLAKDRLAQILSATRRHGGVAAVMFLDLDNFKTINDSLGHDAGDKLLRQVAERLSAAVRESDTVSRLGGDEFLLLMGEQVNEETVAHSAGQVMQQLVRPFDIHGHSVLVTASVGVALYPRDGNDIDALLKSADLAMYQAKDAGRNAFRFFNPDMNRSVVEHLHLASGLRTALNEKQLQVYYQPQFELRTGRLIGAEALLRWQHPALGFIPPSKFIPVAERTGLINEIGAWVLETACRQVQAWQEHGLGPLTVAVNVSPIQFRRDDIEREVANALTQCRLPPSALELELTESLLVEDALHVSEVLNRLHSIGVRFAIDDFGTGYSNLGYLKRFAVQRLKVDQSFVHRMLSHPHDEGIVRAIIEMAHCLEMDVLAEGIEDEATLQRLIGFGCELGQGYLWAPAMHGDEFEDYVRQYRVRATSTHDRVSAAA